MTTANGASSRSAYLVRKISCALALQLFLALVRWSHLIPTAIAQQASIGASQQGDQDATPSKTALADPVEIAPEFVVEHSIHGNSFRVEAKQTDAKPGFRIYRLTYPSSVVTPHAPNNTIPADYYLPDGIAGSNAPRAAVICLHILNGNFELERSLCSSLALRGVPAVMFKLPYYGERSLPGGRAELLANGSLFLQALPQGIADAQRTLDVLAARPEIDGRRIGIVGISLGGIVSATTAGSDARFHRAVLILAGGDLGQIIRRSRETDRLQKSMESLSDKERQAVEQAIADVDPLTHAPSLRQRAMDGRVLMINADADEVIPPDAARKLATALGIEDRVVWLEGLGHYTAAARLPEIMEKTVAFFSQDLPPDAVVPTAERAPNDPYRILAGLLAETGKMLVDAPSPGRCHIAELSATLTDGKGKSYQGKLRWVRGAGEHFRLDAVIPEKGEASFGQGEVPWMANGKTLFRGAVEEPLPAGEATPLVAPADAAKLKLVATALKTITAAPAILEQLVRLRFQTHSDGTSTLSVSPTREKKKASMDLRLDKDGKTVRSIVIAVNDWRGEATLHDWQTDGEAVDGLFEPPANLKIKEVPAAELRRIFSSLCKFAMEQLP